MAITSIKTGSSFTNLQKYDSFLAGNSAYIPTSFESIATATGTGSSGTITFSSIPSTYKHLQIRVFAKTTTNAYYDNLGLRCNGSSTASDYNYSHYLQGDGATVTSGAFTSVTYGYPGLVTGSGTGTTSTNGAIIIDILDYANTSKNKTIRSFSGLNTNTSSFESIILSSCVYYSTSAISSLSLIATSGDNFTTTTTVALYGIKG